MEFYFETDNLILRDFLETDQVNLFEMESEDLVHKFLGNNPMKSPMEALEIILKVQLQYQENGIGRWVILEKSSGEFAGWCGLKFIREIENNHVNYYDVGYRLQPKFWGLGYATESTQFALEYGFNDMNLKEIIGKVNMENIASKRVLEKCG